MKFLQNLYKLITNILKVIAILTLALMTITVFYSVVARFILNKSLAWAEELSRFLMMWMTLSGAVIAYEESKHMSFDSLVHAMPKPVQVVIQIASYILIFWLLFWRGSLLPSYPLPSEPRPLQHCYRRLPLSENRTCTWSSGLHYRPS